MNKPIAQLLCLALFSLGLSGCAFSTDKISLTYNARGARDKVPGAEGVKVEVNVTDQRDVRERVGKKMNGFGQEVGAIVSTTDVVDLVRGAIETELAARGFAKGEAVVVGCELKRYYNRFKVGFWAGDSIAEIILNVRVADHAEQTVFTKNVIAEGLEPNVQVAAGHNAKASLEMALGKAIENLFEDEAFLPALVKAAGANAPEIQK